MAPFLIPIITAFLTALGATIIRFIEKKILKVDAVKTQTSISEAQKVAQRTDTQLHLSNAEHHNENLIANLNGAFASKRT